MLLFSGVLRMSWSSAGPLISFPGAALQADSVEQAAPAEKERQPTSPLPSESSNPHAALLAD